MGFIGDINEAHKNLGLNIILNCPSKSFNFHTAYFSWKFYTEDEELI